MAVLADLATLVLVLAVALVYDPDSLDLSSPRLPLALLGLPVALVLAAAAPAGAGFRPPDVLVTLALLWTAAAARLSTAPWAAGPALVAAMIAAGAYLIGRRAGARERLISWVSRASLALLVASAVAMRGVFQRPTGADLAGHAPTAVLVGQLGNPDYLAGWLLVVLPAAALGRGGRAFLAAGLIALGWTLSRGAGLALIAAALAIWRPGRSLGLKPVALALASGLVLTGFAATAPADRAKLTSAVTLEKRLAIWRTALALTADHPFAGRGPGTFPAAYEAARPPDPFGAGRLPPSDFAHCLPLQVAVEHGLAGLALLFAAVALFVPRALAQTDPLSRALACGALAFLLHNLVSVTAYVLPVLFVGALFAGAAVTRLYPPPADANPRAMALLALFAALVTFLAAPWALSRNRALHEAGMARRALERHRPADALPHALAALAEDPNVTAVRYLAAGALAEAGKPRAALAQYLLLEAQEPAFGHQGFDRARVLIDLSRPSAAISELERSLAFDPNYQDWYALSEARWAAGDAAGSRAALDRARALAPTPDVAARLDALARQLAGSSPPSR